MINPDTKSDIEKIAEGFVNYIHPILAFEERYSESELIKVLPEIYLFIDSVNKMLSDSFKNSIFNNKNEYVELIRYFSLEFNDRVFASEVSLVIRIQKTNPPSGPYAFAQIGQPYYWAFSYRGEEIGNMDTIINRHIDIPNAIFCISKIIADELIRVVIDNGLGSVKLLTSF